MMEYRILGNSGEKISAIGLGAWQFSESWGVLDYEVAKQVIEEAYLQGINFIDTAIVYGKGRSEEYVGRAINELKIQDDVYVATKIPGEMLSEHDVLLALKGSLRRLRIDHIDLIQVHWPPIWNNIPTCTYMRALEKAVFFGMADYIGVSNFPPILIEEAQSCLAREEIVSVQVRYNLIEREAELEILPYTQATNMTLIAWSPLAKGALTGKYRAGKTPIFNDVRASEPIFIEENLKAIEPLLQKIEELASKYGKTPSQIALNWLLNSSDNVVPIPGAKNREQVRENAGAVGWSLTRDDWLDLAFISSSIIIKRSLAIP
jgi:aryl-alcohol dehydrogenase-like predicted oxidoreductase